MHIHHSKRCTRYITNLIAIVKNNTWFYLIYWKDFRFLRFFKSSYKNQVNNFPKFIVYHEHIDADFCFRVIKMRPKISRDLPIHEWPLILIRDKINFRELRDRDLAI